MVIGAFVLVITLIGLFIASSFTQQVAPLPGKMVLYLNLDGDLTEQPAQSSLTDPFSSPEPTVHELVDTIDRASKDKRVKGIMARMNGGSFSLARSDELRNAIKRFRLAGKFAYIYSSSYGEGAGDMGRYYLASAFQEIWMQPLGIVSMPGAQVEVPFVKGLLDKVGVYPQFYHRKEYKTAYESFTNNQMSEPNHEELTQVVGDIRDEIVKNVPPERNISAENFEKLVDKGLFTAPEALNVKLIDHADYADTLIERIKKDVTGDPKASDDDVFVDPEQYAQSGDWQDEVSHLAVKRPSVAVIYVVGLIMESNAGDDSPLSGGERVAASDDIAPAILDAADDKSIAAIVLRIDSPGGSPVASESILRALAKAKAKGKPVIVSMGPTAASGGYWIATNADQIFVMPSTLTGSIGVLGGKFSGAELAKKLGVNMDGSVKWGENAGMWSLATPFSNSQAERINAMLDMVYKAFVERVAQGRGMTVEQVDRIAGGRVWTGTRALKNGLADQMGGMREALNYAARILGVKDKTQLNIVTLPKPKTALEKLAEFMGAQTLAYENMRFQNRIFAYFAPMLRNIAVMDNSHGYAAYEPMRLK